MDVCVYSKATYTIMYELTSAIISATAAILKKKYLLYIIIII